MPQTPSPPLHGRQSNCENGYPSWLFLLGALIAVGPLSIDMYLPGFPAIAREFTQSSAHPEYSLASFFVGMALGQLAYGPLSDRFGRKPPLLAGFALYTVASVACALAPSLAALTAWRFVEALGGCAGMVTTRAVIRDRCGVRDSARAFSMLMLVMGVAPILAPLLGSLIVADLGWRAVFWFLTAFGTMCLLAVHFALQESHDIRHESAIDWHKIGQNYLFLLKERTFMAYTLASGLAMSALFAFIAGSPHVMISVYGLSTEQYGIAFGCNAAAFILASQINARLLKLRPPTSILRLALRATALIASCLVVLGLLGSPSFAWLMVLLLLSTASLGFIVPNATAAALATHGQLAGTASALMGALQFGLATLAGAIMGMSQGNSAAPLAWLMAACAYGAWSSHRFLLGHVIPRSHQ